MLLCVEILQQISTSFETEDFIEILNYYSKFGIGAATEMLNCKIHSLFLPVQSSKYLPARTTDLTPTRLPPHLQQ